MGTGKNGAGTSPARELLQRKESGEGPHPLAPLDHLAYAIITEVSGDHSGALTAIGRLRQTFVDWNEVRVARIQEIARALGDLPEAEAVARRIRDEYNAFFEKKGALNFEFLAAGKPAEVRRHLNQLLPGIGKGAVSLLLYEFCPGASMPLSDDGQRQARKDGVVGKTGDRGAISRFFADGLEADEAVKLLQYWELEANGIPYSEPLKKDGGTRGRKNGAKTKAAAPKKE